MKKIAYNILIMVLASLLYACDSQKIDHEYGGPWFISFEGNGLTAVESQSAPVKIPVQLVAALQKEATTVKFKVSGSSLQEGVDYKLLNETDELTFAPGVHMQYVEIQLFDNMNVTGDRELQLELVSSASGLSVGQAGEAAKGKTFTLTVQEDDCQLTMDLFNGKVTALETTPWWGKAGQTGDVDGKFPLTFTPIRELAPGKIEYTLKGLWYCQLEHAGSDTWAPGLDGFDYKEITVVIDYTNTANPTMSWAEQVVAEFSGGDDWMGTEATIAASTDQAVQLSTCGKTLVFKYSIVEQSWASDFKVTVNFNK